MPINTVLQKKIKLNFFFVSGKKRGVKGVETGEP